MAQPRRGVRAPREPFFRPFGAGLSTQSHPRLTPWAIFYRRSAAVAFVLMAFALAGCGGTPSKANIELRKQNQDLRDQIGQLQSSNQAAQARVAALEGGRGTLPTLPADRLDQLFTVHGLKIGRLSGGSDTDSAAPGDEMLKVYVAPVDQAGDVVKSAGEFTVEAFDLTAGNKALIGKWTFPLDQARSNWYGQALLDTYVLACPWQTVPASEKLTIRVVFLDALTQRQFEATSEVRLVPPQRPTTAP